MTDLYTTRCCGFMRFLSCVEGFAYFIFISYLFITVLRESRHGIKELELLLFLFGFFLCVSVLYFIPFHVINIIVVIIIIAGKWALAGAGGMGKARQGHGV